MQDAAAPIGQGNHFEVQKKGDSEGSKNANQSCTGEIYNNEKFTVL